VIALVVTSMGVSLSKVALLAGLFYLRLVAVLVASVFAVAITSGFIFTTAKGFGEFSMARTVY
jgi:hypothetical protein